MGGAPSAFQHQATPTARPCHAPLSPRAQWEGLWDGLRLSHAHLGPAPLSRSTRGYEEIPSLSHAHATPGVQRRAARVTVKYNRQELQRRLDTEQWIDGRLGELYRGRVTAPGIGNGAGEPGTGQGTGSAPSSGSTAGSGSSTGDG
uniref:Uncharacterized protein n=1 Tax=Geospiza parvula TaxID=87175 RepID=A0A8U8B553_GEOPR